MREHPCVVPNFNRFWKREGIVYACTCGQLFRAHLIHAPIPFWEWDQIK